MAAYTTIDNPELYFQCKLYTGNGSTNAITLDGDENMQPDLLWLKRRDGSDNHILFDDVRGVTKGIYADLNNAEDNLSDSLSSFDSNGFTLGADTAGSGTINGSSETYVAWAWKESATAGFDIVGYTGNATARTISHSLSAVPKVILGKRRSDASNWCMYHASHGNTKALYLNDTTTGATSTTFWNDTNPTSSVFTVGTDAALNGNTDTQIAYLWSEKQGFSKFGSYEGNGNADGTFVYTGFSPSFVMLKEIDQTGNWCMSDNKRPGYNPTNMVNANEAGAETTDGTNTIDHLSNGFKLRTTGSSSNTSNSTYIYMAFAEAPFVNSNGVPCNAK